MSRACCCSARGGQANREGQCVRSAAGIDKVRSVVVLQVGSGRSIEVDGIAILLPHRVWGAWDAGRPDEPAGTGERSCRRAGKKVLTGGGPSKTCRPFTYAAFWERWNG